LLDHVFQLSHVITGPGSRSALWVKLFQGVGITDEDVIGFVERCNGVLDRTGGFLPTRHARGVTEPKAWGFNPDTVTARADKTKGHENTPLG
jgi:hypothetical protein